MDHQEVGRYWEANAEAWTIMSRAGADICRDGFNTPRFLEMLPNVAGLRGLDIGCGEGTNTRRVAALGATMTGIDISPTFVRHAAESADNPSDLRFFHASATSLPFAEGAFDFAVSFMCFMDFGETAAGLAEAYRVIRPGGFLQFSILHPCFVPPHRRHTIKDRAQGIARIETGRYFEHTDGEMEQWTFGNAPPQMKERFGLFQVPCFHRTLSWWLNAVIDAGFTIERIGEPRPTDADVERYPGLWDEQQVPLFIHIRGRKVER